MSAQAPPTATSTTTAALGRAASDTPSPAPVPAQQEEKAAAETMRAVKRMAGEGGEVEPVLASEAEGVFLDQPGLFLDSQMAYEIHC